MQRKGVSEKRADETARCVDVDGSGQIEWSEFVAAMLPACHLGPAVDLTFKQLDLKNDGQIDRAELIELLKDGTINGHEMSSPLAHIQTDMMLNEMGTSSEQITMQDFQGWFAQGSFFSPESCVETSKQFSWAEAV
jgi:Ca2+-binding EF-hand superfamily protein